MKSARILQQLRDAIGNLNPAEVRESAHRPVSLELHATNPTTRLQMENFFAPAETLSETRRSEVKATVRSAGEGGLIKIYEAGLVKPPDGFIYQPGNPDTVVLDVLQAKPDLKLALARQYDPFRCVVTKDTIWTISKESAMFSVATAVPSMVPLISLPWAAGEFASDTAFLTANQIRMAFILAAASDRTVGYREQKSEIASLFAGAFGWRALARELVGKIPMGGGLLPKAAIAFAGTYVVGVSLERLYRVGYGLAANERKDAYKMALEKGKAVAASLIENYMPRRSA
jgi:hypothetical protein